MILISCLYTRIWINLKNSEPIETNAQVHARFNGRGKVIRMLVMVVLAFFISWAPFHVQRLLALYFYDFFSAKVTLMLHKISRVTGVLFYSSAVINPIIYNVMSNKFRQAFKETLVRGLKIFRSSQSLSTSTEQDVAVKT